jgi:hypothetical protein
LSTLIAAFAILGIAVLLGAALFVRHLRNAPCGATAWRLAALHGLIGVGGLVCLLFALRHPPLRAAQGAAGFGAISVVMLALAALFGGGIFVIRLAKRRAGMLIGIHATIAISGFVILAAYVLV